MKTASFKQYKIHRDETGCYGQGVNSGRLQVATLFEHGLGGIDKGVHLMRKDMGNHAL